MAIFNLSEPSPAQPGSEEPGPELSRLEQSGPEQPRPDEQSPGPKKNAGSGFPFKMALTILVLEAALVIWHEHVDHNKGMDASLFAETFQLHLPHLPAPVV